MERRQKILLGVMGVTVLAGLYMQFATGGPAPAVDPKPAAAVALPGADQLKLAPAESYRLEVLAQNATSNPFYKGLGVLTAEEPSGQGEGPVYSGFIQAGKRAFAVLDGIEYGPGDELAEGGWKVKGIDRSFVALERTDGSTGRKVAKNVPLVESDADKIRIRVVKKR